MKTEDIRIMCVDDSATIRKVVKSFLEDSYKNLYFATNGQEGIELFDKVHPHIVISDINMPVMKGLEMVRKLQAKNDGSTYFIMLSTEQGDRFINQAARQGVSAYIGKSEANRRLKPAIDKLKKIILEDKVDLKFAQYQPLLELNEDMTILSDGHKIYSSNEAFLSFIGVDSLESFIANYGSVEYLVDEIEGVALDSLEITWLEILLSKKEGVYVYIETQDNERVKLLSKAVLLEQRGKIYAITFTSGIEESTEYSEESVTIDNENSVIETPFFENIVFSSDMLESYLCFILPSLQSKEKHFGFSVYKLQKIDALMKNPQSLKKVLLFLNAKLDNLEQLYLYEKNIVIFHHSIDSDLIKERAKDLNTLLKNKGLAARIGVLSSKNKPSYEKIIEYLKKF